MFLCGDNLRCIKLNCAHYVCHECITCLIREQVATRNLRVVYPSRECEKFVNYSNLPFDTKMKYLRALLLDFNEKTIDNRGRFTNGKHTFVSLCFVSYSLLCFQLVFCFLGVGFASRLRVILL